MARGYIGRAIVHPKFLAVKKLAGNLFVGTIFVQNGKFKVKNSILGKINGKVKILRTHDLLCPIFASVCRIICRLQVEKLQLAVTPIGILDGQ